MKRNLNSNRNVCLKILFGFLSIFILNSCLGLDVDIQMKKDGSSKVVLEYRFSRMAQTIGKLDGNENWPIIPIGREDWKRTEQRIEGMKLLSFSSKEDARDIINKVTLEFKTTDALLKFLDSSGKRASLRSEGGRNKLQLILNERASAQLDSDLLELVKQVSEGYSFNISFSTPGKPIINITDGEGNEVLPGSSFTSSKKAALILTTKEILIAENGLGLNLIW